MSPRKSLVAILMALLFFAIPTSCFAEYGNSSVQEPIDGAKTVNQKSDRVYQKTCEELYQKAWKTLEQKFLFRQDIASWAEWQHKYDGKLTSLAQTEDSVNEMVGSLHDQYTFFLNAKETSAKDVESNKTGVVSCEMLSSNIGYIKVNTFSSRNTAKEIAQALQALKSATSLIIDLRDNRGGYIDEALHAASLFIQEGVFVTLESQESPTVRKSQPLLITKQYYTSVDNFSLSCMHQPAIKSDIPVVILVNKSTCSAAEMFAGCLQEHKRAIAIGTVTTGKGICQDLTQLPLGASLRYTYAFWHLPVSGTCIHKTGLTPDFVTPAQENIKDAAIKLIRSTYVTQSP